MPVPVPAVRPSIQATRKPVPSDATVGFEPTALALAISVPPLLVKVAQPAQVQLVATVSTGLSSAPGLVAPASGLMRLPQTPPARPSVQAMRYWVPLNAAPENTELS